MSSILDALRKAERESAAENGKGTPWPAPPAGSPVDDQRRRRWWIPLGLMTVLCVLAFVFWLTRRPGPDRRPEIAQGTVEPVATEKIQPTALPDHQVPSTTHQPVAVLPSPSASARPAQEKPLPAMKTDVSPKKPSPRNKQKPTQMPEVRSRSLAAPPQAPTRQPSEMKKGPPPPEEPQSESQKTFRSDERVDLQALVWAPEAADRFVIINNRLIREGGSVDKITVVRINPDDVLLSEGTDRWYQAFKIR